MWLNICSLTTVSRQVANLNEVVYEAVKNWYMQHSVDGVNWLLEVNGIFLAFTTIKCLAIPLLLINTSYIFSGATILDHSTPYCPGMIITLSIKTIKKGSKMH